MSDEQYFRAMYEAEKAKTPSEMFSDWLYKNVRIGNGDMLIEAMENTILQEQFLREYGLPEDTEL